MRFWLFPVHMLTPEHRLPVRGELHRPLDTDATVLQRYAPGSGGIGTIGSYSYPSWHLYAAAAYL